MWLYKQVVRAHVVCIGAAFESGDLEQAVRKRRWGDGLATVGHQRKGGSVMSRIHCASQNPDSGERDVAGVTMVSLWQICAVIGRRGGSAGAENDWR